MKYNHISLDIWLTLIRSNPKFKEARNKLIFTRYNDKNLVYEDVCKIIRTIDVNGNKKSEVTGIHIDSKILLYDILYELNDNFTVADINNLDQEIQDLFLEFPPSLYDDNTKSVLETLRIKGVTLSILSNTGFINGDTLRKTLTKLGIFELFTFTLYSDEIRVSKPNTQAFNLVHSNITNKFSGRKILHVGDNPIADGGSISANIDYLQINTNDKTIKDVEKILTTQN